MEIQNYRKLEVLADGGSSSAGRASDCGSECRGFKSHLPPQFSFPAEEQLHLVRPKRSIRRHQSHFLCYRLRDEQSVKRVPMMRWKFACTQCMFMSDIERPQPPGAQRERNVFRGCFWQRQGAARKLNGNFPSAHSRKEQFLRRCGQDLLCASVEFVVCIEAPKEYARIQKELHAFF